MRRGDGERGWPWNSFLHAATLPALRALSARALAGSVDLFDALLAHGVEQRVGAPMSRNDQCGVDLDERHQRERALDKTGMRNDQIGFVDGLIAEEQDVEIERARCVAKGPFAAELMLDLVAQRKQMPRGDRGLDLDDAIEIVVTARVDRGMMR